MTRVCTTHDHVYSSIANYHQLNTCYTTFMSVEYCFISDHQESSQPFIVDCVFQPLSNSRHAAHFRLGEAISPVLESRYSHSCI